MRSKNMKACWLAACAAIGICLFTGGCEPSSTGSSGGDVAALRGDIAALRGDVDRLNAEVARLKARIAAIGPRSEMAPAAGPRPTVETARPRKVDRKQIEEMRRRHEEHMKRLREEKSGAGAGASAPASAAEPAGQQKAN